MQAIFAAVVVAHILSSFVRIRRRHTGVLPPVNLGGGPVQRCRHVGVTEATRPDDAEPWHGRAKDDAPSSRALPLLFTEESVYVVTP
ncbi:hypothetical protein HPB50_017309 [Hyalomma asiaticum]|uniref:Uncharacterized protein n=1 Tax=Hyalomma asiaticum TaxID=266040 RepID=A0ACB7TQN6_HYAAI|nr:hypothetical protein HPB50_017309 [Hyalomma asiaticum]